MQINDYRDLEVWQLGRRLARKLYQLTAKFPDEEKFGLVSQLRRAGVSIPSNVAEGWGRHYTAEFIQGLRRANGSRTEVETQMILSADLGYATTQEVEALLKETALLGKQLLALERSLQKRMENRE
ncbi:four helix bundle protein [Fontisphaera persica]|uniref:four helix bundle protein n=1 Tax=Fontisphaera persica TaxID=2974023 RepID=UPI0024BF4815|nr:four helix bundle protein [Fontisphaera persica]WCJ60898.1 four helix bundle protein [Fontisphaera persica]